MSLADYATTPNETQRPGDTGTQLVNYVMDRVDRWRKFRDGNYSEDWAKYDAVYSGTWVGSLKTKAAERSRVITPVTTNAVDQAVSEIIEAIFGRGAWFDVDEDGKPDIELQAAKALQAQLLDDLHDHDIKRNMVAVVLNGAKFGTGIAKRIIDEEDVEALAPVAPPQQGAPPGAAPPQPGAPPAPQQAPQATPPPPKPHQEKQPYVSWEAVLPRQFVIDTSATTIKDAHGVAHETLRPKHEIERKQKSGEFLGGEIGTASGYGSADILTGPDGENYLKDPLDGVYMTEYHGLVPKWMLAEALKDQEPDDPLDIIAEDDDEDATAERDDLDVVEAIVTIGNGSTLLKAVENPILNKDRGFIAYQHYPVPNRFWGMGVPEKAWNSQNALDGEVRARLDTLAIVSYPSITADATRLPRQLDLTVAPGKVYRTNGRGSEIIEPLKFGTVDPNSFQHSADLERYVQLATGASDPTTGVNTNRSAQATASGNSMSFGSYIKRAKLPMQNIDEQFLDPLVRKTLLAYMTVAPDRYPALFDYTVNSTLSIMAREFEQMQLTNLMALLPQGSPEYNTVLKAIITNYSGPAKAQLLADIEKAQQPNPQQQQQQQIQLETAQAQLKKLQAQVDELGSRTQYTQSKIGTEQTKLAQHAEEINIQKAQTLVDAHKSSVAEAAVHHGTTQHLVAAMTKAHATKTQADTARFQAAQAAKAAAAKPAP